MPEKIDRRLFLVMQADGDAADDDVIFQDKIKYLDVKTETVNGQKGEQRFGQRRGESF